MYLLRLSIWALLFPMSVCYFCCVQRTRSFCYTWLRRRKVLCRSRCLLTMVEGCVTASVVFALVYQAVFSGISLGDLLHLTDFFFVALCVALVARPWLISLCIGGSLSRARVFQRAKSGLLDVLNRKVAMSTPPEGQCSSCELPARPPPRVLFQRAPPSGQPTAAGTLSAASRRLSSISGAQSAVQKWSAGSSTEPLQPRVHHNSVLATGVDQIATPFSSSENLQGPAGSLRSLTINTEPHQGTAATATLANGESLLPRSSPWRERLGASFVFFLLCLPVVFLLTLPWLVSVLQLLFHCGAPSALHHLSLIPYAFPSWWLVLAPCIAVVFLLATIFRPFSCLLGPEKLLRAADDVCVAAGAISSSEGQQRSRNQSLMRKSFTRGAYERGRQQKADPKALSGISEVHWASDAFSVLALREIENTVGLNGPESISVEKQRLVNLRLSILSNIVAYRYPSNMLPCAHHREHHASLLQRIATTLPMPLDFALRNSEAVRHSLSLRPSSQPLVKSSKSLRLGNFPKS